MNKDSTCHTNSRISGIQVQAANGLIQPEIRDRIPGFHTDFTQIDRSGPHTLRHPGQPTNAQMPMKSQKAAHSAGLLADPPSGVQMVAGALFPELAGIGAIRDSVGFEWLGLLDGRLSGIRQKSDRLSVADGKRI